MIMLIICFNIPQFRNCSQLVTVNKMRPSHHHLRVVKYFLSQVLIAL